MRHRIEFSGGVSGDSIADPSEPGGAKPIRFRERLANVNENDDGLLVEMAKNLAPADRTPWCDREHHAWAVRQLERGPYPGMSEEQQRDALAYVQGSAFYE